MSSSQATVVMAKPSHDLHVTCLKGCQFKCVLMRGHSHAGVPDTGLMYNSAVGCRLRRGAIPPGFDAEMVVCVLCNQSFKDLCEACGTARPARQRGPNIPRGGGGGPPRGGGPAGALSLSHPHRYWYLTASACCEVEDVHVGRNVSSLLVGMFVTFGCSTGDVGYKCLSGCLGLAVRERGRTGAGECREWAGEGTNWETGQVSGGRGDRHGRPGAQQGPAPAEGQGRGGGAQQGQRPQPHRRRPVRIQLSPNLSRYRSCTDILYSERIEPTDRVRVQHATCSHLELAQIFVQSLRLSSVVTGAEVARGGAEEGLLQRATGGRRCVRATGSRAW